MRILFFICIASLAGMGVCLVDPLAQARAAISWIKMFAKSYKDTKEDCHANVSLCPLKWIGIELSNDDTSNATRSYFDNFKRATTRGQGISKFQVGVEFKNPEVVPTSDKKVATIKWHNLLFTSSLLVQNKSDQSCQNYAESYLGFVELVQTDTTWYKYRNIGIELKELNLGKHPDFQEYVVTKPSRNSRYIFADDKSSLLHPAAVDYDRIVQLKYESIENITVDFKQYPETLEYEKLVEKKIFLVQMARSGQVLKVLAGVDVMMYLDYMTYNVTDTVHLTLNKNHSLIQWIVNADSYRSTLNDDGNRKFRDRGLSYEWKFQNPSTTSLNPLLDGQKIYTAK